MLLKCIIDGGLGANLPAAGGYEGLGAKLSAAGRFFVFFEKKAILMPLNHISPMFRAIWKNMCLA